MVPRKHFLDHVHRIVTDHMDDLAAFGGGAGFSLFAWLRTHPEVVVGKLLATLVLGFVGGVGGITAKFVCNRLFNPRKSNRNGKNNSGRQ